MTDFGAVIFIRICVILEYFNSDDHLLLMPTSRVIQSLVCQSINLQRYLNCVFTLNVCVNLRDKEKGDVHNVDMYISLIPPLFRGLKGVALCYFLKRILFHKNRI